MLSRRHGREHPRQGAPSQARRPRPAEGEQPRPGRQGRQQTGVCLLSPPLAKLAPAGLPFCVREEGGRGFPTAGLWEMLSQGREAQSSPPVTRTRGRGDTGTGRQGDTGTRGWASRGQVLSWAAGAQPPWTRQHRPACPPAQAHPSTHPRRRLHSPRPPTQTAHLGIPRLPLHRSCRDTGGWLRRGRSGPRTLPDRHTAL